MRQVEISRPIKSRFDDWLYIHFSSRLLRRLRQCLLFLFLDYNQLQTHLTHRHRFEAVLSLKPNSEKHSGIRKSFALREKD